MEKQAPRVLRKFTCLRPVSGGRIQCCHPLSTLTEKQTLAKNAVNKYFAFNVLLHFDVIAVCLYCFTTATRLNIASCKFCYIYV